MARTLLVLTIVLLGGWVATASASAGRGPLTRAAGVAQAFWGAAPCGGKIDVVTRRRARSDLDPGSDAWVTFNTPLGANVLAAPASTYTACRIFLTRTRWPTRASMRSDWDILCMTVVHEYGHLLGHQHELTADSIMTPVFSDYSSEPGLCRATGPSTAR